MSKKLLPIIDNESCIDCGTCIDICPDRILVAGEPGGIVVTGDRCMECGHCYAVCPVEAIVVPGLESDLGLTTIKEEPADEVSKLVNLSALVRLMRTRRSCRVFKKDPVELSLLNDLVRIGTTAPSGTNSQGWQFVVLADREDVVQLGEVTAEFYRRLNRKAANPFYRFLARLFAGNALARYYERYYFTVEKALDEWQGSGNDRLFHGAPAAIIVSADKSSSCPAEDALLATQNILLAAESMGLATCLIGFVVEAARRDRGIAASLNLSEAEDIYSVIACGYSAISFRRVAGRKPVSPRIVRFSKD